MTTSQDRWTVGIVSANPLPDQALPHSHGDSGVDLPGRPADQYGPAAYPAFQPALSGVCRLPGCVTATCASPLTKKGGDRTTSDRRSVPAGRNFTEISMNYTSMSP